MSVSLYDGRVRLAGTLRVWALAYLGNLLGILVLCLLLGRMPVGWTAALSVLAGLLLLAGHAHGGQWRLPGLLNGLFAPDQGLFPTYAGGRYALGDTTLLVSRGLARESTRLPRFYNRPELVMVELRPGLEEFPAKKE